MFDQSIKGALFLANMGCKAQTCMKMKSLIFFPRRLFFLLLSKVEKDKKLWFFLICTHVGYLSYHYIISILCKLGIRGSI